MQEASVPSGRGRGNLSRPRGRSKFSAAPFGGASAVFQESSGEDLHPKIIKQARQSGQLNLSGRGLTAVPEKVWKINELDNDEQKSRSKGFSIDKVEEEEPWWEQVDLTKLILASNKLTVITAGIHLLPSLTVLDLHDNAIENLPDEIGELSNLTRINLSHNKLKSLPEGFYRMRELRSLQVNHNELVELHEDIGRLDMLESLDVAFNQLEKIPNSIGYLTKMKKFTASNNKIKDLPSEIGFLREVTTIDLTENCLEEVPDSMADLSHIEQLHLRKNRLRKMPLLKNCHHLKEVHLGNNQIAGEVTQEDIENMPNITILDLRDNKIEKLPDEIVMLQSLERLDISNNELTDLPFVMGTLPHMKSLLVDGNPMKALRRDIIARGTQGIMRYLRSRIDEKEMARLREKRQASPVGELLSAPDVPDKFAMKNQQSMNLAKKDICDLPDEAIANAIEAEIRAVDLSKNRFTEVPAKLEQLLPKLYEMNMSFNKLEMVPSFVATAGVTLQFINLANNRLNTLPSEFSSLQNLREIVLSCNRFNEIPACLYDCKSIETLLIADNQVQKINIEGLSKLNRLAILDLQNNDIQQVPPELGRLTQLRSVQLEGNGFRFPRPQVLTKGTAHLLAYLRDRIPTS